MKILTYPMAAVLMLAGCQTPSVVRPAYDPTNPSSAKAAASTPRYYCSLIGLRPEKEAEYRKSAPQSGKATSATTTSTSRC